MIEHARICGRATIILRNGAGEILSRQTVDNLITTIGLEYYGYQGTGIGSQVPTAHFTSGANQTFDGVFGLGSAGSAPSVGSGFADITNLVTGSLLVPDTNYPQNDDTGDADNTGDGINVVTYTRTWAAGVADDPAIDRVFITNPSPTGDENMLMYAVFGAPINKTSNDSLKVIINHTFA